MIGICRIVWLLFPILSACILPACDHGSKIERESLKSLAGRINDVFMEARQTVEDLNTLTHQVLSEPDRYPGLYPDSRYRYTRTHVYETPEEDGKCEVWASGHIPVGAAEKKRIKVLEHLCPELKAAYQKLALVDTLVLTTYDSIVMTYPYSDMIVYMTPGLDLTKAWITCRAAGSGHNPNRTTIWVDPYIDALGRGFVTSVVTPVYRSGFLEAFLRIDISADAVSEAFLSPSDRNLMIVTRSTVPVAVNQGAQAIVNLDGLERYHYFHQQPENRSADPFLRLDQNGSESVRAIGAWISGPHKEAEFEISATRYRFVREAILETGWFLVEMKKIR